MALTQLAPPYPIFTDRDGSPLDNGFLYFGVVNQNPETNPIQVYYDSAFTQPAAQPLRTSNGYVMRNGSPALIYADSQFSVTIRDKKGALVIYSPVGYGVDPASISGTVVYNDFTGDGATTVFVLTASPSTKNATNVYIDGVYQSKDNYNTSGSTLTFSTAPPLNSAIEVVSQESSIIGGASSQQITYNQGGFGAVTRTVQSRLRDFVSVKDFGAVGDGVTDDTAAIQAALNAGSVYFPATDNYYLISDDLTMSDGTTVSGDGYKSQVRQTVQGKNAFVAGHDCVVRGLRIKMVDGNNLDLTKQNAVYIDGKKNVTVQNNWLELADIAVSGVQVRGAAANITVKSNIIYGGKWSSGAGAAATAADILFYSSAASTRIVIDGNYCLSNNSQGIFADALGFNADIAITNNVCVTLDPATCTQGGTWAEIASGGVRRHGIVLGYNNTSVDGPRSVVSGNLCRNTTWTGIYLQGTNAGRLCSNNVCSNNGYATSNSLSGGIYLIQSGYEIIENNLILDFKNTDALGVGAITVNAAPAATAPSTVRGNFIRGSASRGIELSTQCALVEVADNTIIGSTLADISSFPTAGVTTVGGHHIIGNRIFRTSGNDKPSIDLEPQASTRVYRVYNNRIHGFDNTNVSTTNAGIIIRGASARHDIKGNIIENFYHGLYFNAYQATNRDAQIEGNTFVDCSIGISMGATTNNVTVPVVDNRFVGMLVSDTAAALGGGAAARVCTREGTRLVVHTYNAAPTTGDWAIGDRAMFTTPVAGGNIGAVCVTAGTAGTWKTYGAIAA